MNSEPPAFTDDESPKPPTVNSIETQPSIEQLKAACESYQARVEQIHEELEHVRRVLRKGRRN